MFVDPFTERAARSAGALNTVVTAFIAIGLAIGALAMGSASVARAVTAHQTPLTGQLGGRLTF